jgi:hypothetical protein
MVQHSLPFQTWYRIWGGTHVDAGLFPKAYNGVVRAVGNNFVVPHNEKKCDQHDERAWWLVNSRYGTDHKFGCDDNHSAILDVVEVGNCQDEQQQQNTDRNTDHYTAEGNHVFEDWL